jgi:transcriptional regulator GlxA family with amidase domain
VPYPLKISAADKQALLTVKELLEKDITAKYSLKKLCKLSGLNADKLKKGFKILYGMPPLKFHWCMRMKEAQCLLKETEHTVAEIAYATGYEQPNSFCKAFRKFSGVTALEWRRKSCQL